MENDLIRRSDMLNQLDRRFFDTHDTQVLSCKKIAMSIPAVDAVEEKQGFWKAAGTRHPKPGDQRYRKQDQWTVYKCSNCGATNGRNHSDPYCRHCGARMLVDNCRYCYNDERREEAHNAAD